MTAGGAKRRSIQLRAGAALLLLTLIVTACGRPGAGAVEPTPTYIPQPTPDPTMSAIIQGHGAPVTFLPPLEVRGSPTPVPAAGRPVAPAGGRPVPKPAPTASSAQPAPKPAPTVAAPRPAPTAARPANSGAAPAAPANTGPAGPAPAIINPSNLLPGATRPNPTPGR